MELLTIEWSRGEVSGRLVGDGDIGVLLAHGAGTTQDHPRMIGLAQALATAAGVTVLTFNYPYAESGRRRPDPQATLLACHSAAGELLRGRTSKIFLGGRSMGGRMGTYLAAQGEPCAGLLLFAYPLHPAGRPDKLRVDHLPSIESPMLFVQGTRDALCRIDLLDQHVRGLRRVTIELVDGADHSFRLSGVSPADMDARLASIGAAWIAGI